MRRLAVVGFVLLGTSCLAFSQSTDLKPVFIFCGKQLYVGMSKREAVTALSPCTKLSPPADVDIEKRPVRQENTMLGHMILTKQEPLEILGNIFFSEERVLSITRPLDNEVDTYNEHLVNFARALKRSLPEGETFVTISVRHEHTTNAESDVVSFSFPNGRGIEVLIGTLDKPFEGNADRRDFVTLNETLR